MSLYFDREEPHHQDQHPDTEFTLSTASLLGIFFGLVLVCGVFFGFGYSMGRRSAVDKSAGSAQIKSGSGAAPLNATTTVTNENKADSHPRPSASQPALPVPSPPSTVRSAPAALAPPTIAGRSPAAPVPTPPQVRRSGDSTMAAAAARPSAGKRPVIEAAAPQSKPLPYGSNGTNVTNGTYGSLAPPPYTAPAVVPQPTIVQIAAVSHQEDADVLVAALKKRGYNVAVRHEPQDQLMHVQVGPFTTRADAVAMRQKLLADGYNAMVKP